MDATTGAGEKLAVDEQKSLIETVSKISSTVNNNNSTNPSNNSIDLNINIYQNELMALVKVVNEVLEEIVAKVVAIVQTTQLQKAQDTQVSFVAASTTTTTVTDRAPSSSPDDELSSDLIIDSDLPSVEAQEPPLVQPDTEPLFGSFSAVQKPTESANAMIAKTADTAATICLSDSNSSESKSKTQMQVDEEQQSNVTAPTHYSSDIVVNTNKKDDEIKQPDEAATKEQQPEAKETQADGQLAKPESITSETDKSVVESKSLPLPQAVAAAQVDDELMEEDVPLETKTDKVDMVELKNLTPNLTPQPPVEGSTISNSVTPVTSTPSETPPVQGTSSRAKRTRAKSPQSASDLDESTDGGGGESSGGGRTKRQRRQTNLFQAGDALKPSPTKTPPKANASLTSSKPKSASKKPPPRNTRTKQPVGNQQNEKELEQDKSSVAPHHQSQLEQGSKDNVIYYEKFDFLAIRNEEKSFYLCQVQENVSVNKQTMKVRWFDTKDNDKTYYLTELYDTIPQLSVLMPVTLEKSKPDFKGKYQYFLSESDRSIILDRLARSLNAAQSMSNSQTD